MRIFQTTFSDSDHFRGRSVASLRPSPVGPRQSGQLAKARVEFAKKKTRKVISQDFPFNFINGSPAHFDTVFEALLYNPSTIMPKLHLNFNNFPVGSACLSGLHKLYTI
jgi:hypothetical protein